MNIKLKSPTVIWGSIFITVTIFTLGVLVAIVISSNIPSETISLMIGIVFTFGAMVMMMILLGGFYLIRLWIKSNNQPERVTQAYSQPPIMQQPSQPPIIVVPTNTLPQTSGSPITHTPPPSLPDTQRKFQIIGQNWQVEEG